MMARYAIGIVALLASAPALAQSLDAAAAQRFVLDKLFAFTCVDGSRGSGRVFDDGSVIGTIQLGGMGWDHLVIRRAVNGPTSSAFDKGEMCESRSRMPSAITKIKSGAELAHVDGTFTEESD